MYEKSSKLRGKEPKNVHASERGLRDRPLPKGQKKKKKKQKQKPPIKAHRKERDILFAVERRGGVKRTKSRKPIPFNGHRVRL